MKLPFFIRI
ncbi:hypothetical protein YPPY88_4141, partial [Yersinia pestis PY-88]